MTTRPAAAVRKHEPIDRDYYQAVADDGMIERQKLLKRLADAAAGGDVSNEQLRRGIERMRKTVQQVVEQEAATRLQFSVLSPTFWKVPNRLHR